MRVRLNAKPKRERERLKIRVSINILNFYEKIKQNFLKIRSTNNFYLKFFLSAKSALNLKGKTDTFILFLLFPTHNRM